MYLQEYLSFQNYFFVNSPGFCCYTHEVGSIRVLPHLERIGARKVSIEGIQYPS